MEITCSIGRRKSSVARIYLTPGKGTITVNNRSFADYFSTDILQTIVKQPLSAISADGNFDVKINVKGGGFKGQAEAVRLAISRALCQIDEENRSPLKKEGFLTRDSRMVERKKPGRKKARKKFQFSKR